MKSILQLKPILVQINRFRTLLLILGIIAICGWTAYQISLVVAITPDAATIAAARKNLSDTNIRFDSKTIQAITKQSAVSVAPNLSNIGTTDPFYGQ